jgi:hypothetical protein
MPTEDCQNRLSTPTQPPHLQFHVTELFDVSIACSLFLAWYTYSYLQSPDRPSANGHSLGWWTWADQGEYLRSAQALLRLDFSPALHVYPPLYSLAGAVFLPIFPLHPFFPVNAMLLLVFVSAFAWIGGRLYGRLVALPVLIFIFWEFPSVTLQHWEIPWTSSLSAGLVSVLLAAFFWFSEKDKPWFIDRPTDWIVLVGFYLLYGAIFATRPLDVIPLFPMAFVLYAKVLLAIAHAPEAKKWKNLIPISLSIAISGLCLPAVYLTFNFFVFGDAFGGYLSLAASRGYYPGELFQKAVSLLFDGSAIYLEQGTALIVHFWPAIIALPVVVVSTLRAPLFVRVVSVSILLHFCIYLPFRDLLPVTLFRFGNVHYFKWVLPWMTLIATGQIITWVKALWQSKAAIPELIATFVLVTVVLNIDLSFSAFETVPDRRNNTSRTLTADLRDPARFSVFDISHLPNDLTQYLYEVDIDGQRLPKSDFHMVPAPWGTRIVFMHSEFGQHLQLRFYLAMPGLQNGIGLSRSGLYHFTFLCRFAACPSQAFSAPEPIPVATIPDKLRINFSVGAGADKFLKSGWSAAEGWGRWTESREATLIIPPQETTLTNIEIVLEPFITYLRRNQEVSVSVNDCRIINIQLQFPDDEQPLAVSSPLPLNCTEVGQSTRITIATDRIVTPSDVLTASPDKRKLGVGLISISIN